MPRSASIRFLTILAVLAVLGGCSARPLPLSVQAGASVAIALAGEAALGDAVGYGGELLAASGRHDDQRGELRFVLQPIAGGSEREVSTRIVTRVLPDPASETGLRNSAHASLAAFGIAQIVAILDVPSDVAPGEYEVSVRRLRRTDYGESESLPAPLYGQRISVLPATVGSSTGAPTPSTTKVGAFEADASAQLIDLIPLPKLVLALPKSPPPAALRLVLGYPAEKIRPRAVIEEQHLGRSSIVSWRDDPERARVTVDLVDPSASVEAIALVFEPKQPLSAGRIGVSEVFVVSSTLYDRDGREREGAVTPVSIR
jgi:hypothetical protein